MSDEPSFGLKYRKDTLVRAHDLTPKVKHRLHWEYERILSLFLPTGSFYTGRSEFPFQLTKDTLVRLRFYAQRRAGLQHSTQQRYRNYEFV